jgi:hypothetical protein
MSNVDYGGKEVDLQVPGTNMQRCRKRVDNFTFLEHPHHIDACEQTP